MNNYLIMIGIVIAVGALILFLNKSKKDTAMNISAEEFKQKLIEEPGVVIDVRTKGEFNEGHLAKTDYNYDIMSGEFQNKLKSMDKKETYYLYCRSGNRSGKAASIMKREGFENVYNIGGYGDLVDAGLESEL